MRSRIACFLILLMGWLPLAASSSEGDSHPAVTGITLHGSRDEAIRAILLRRPPAYAAWANSNDRGSAGTVSERREDKQICRDVAWTRQGISETRFVEDVTPYCVGNGSISWRENESVYAGLDRTDRDKTMNNVRILVPPPGFRTGSLWRDAVSSQYLPSFNAALTFAIQSADEQTVPWKTGKTRGVVASRNRTNPKTKGLCRTLLMVREEGGRDSEDILTVCRETLGVWNGADIGDNRQFHARDLHQLHEQLTKVGSVPVAKPDPAAPAKAAARAPAEERAPAVAPEEDKDMLAMPAKRATSVEIPPPPGKAGTDVLAGFPGFQVSDEKCETAGTEKGVPWGTPSGAGGPTSSSSAHRNALQHAQRMLRVIYGRLGTEREKGLDVLWAPFFDHQTAPAQHYFARLNPLLEDYLAALSELDGLLPGYQDAVVDVYVGVAAASPGWLAAAEPVARLQHARVQATRSRLEDLNRKIAALGPAPNPLAAKCQARARHKRLFQGDGELWQLLRATHFLAGGEGGDEGNTVGNFTAIAGNTPRTTLTWKDRRFTYRAQTASFDRPCASSARQVVIGNPETRTEATGEVSADGARILSFSGTQVSRECEGRNTPRERVKEETQRFSTSDKGLRLYRGRPVESGARIRLLYTNAESLDLSFKTPPPRGSLLVEFRNYLQNLESKTVAEIVEESRIELGGKPRPGARTGDRNAGLVRDTGADIRGTGAGTADTATGAGAGLSTDEERQARQEAITQHEELARQMKKDGERWAEDARREKDPARKAELEKRAEAARSNAQNEQDIAESLKTGSLVHTRTGWDERMHEELIASIEENNRRSRAESDALSGIHQLRQAIQPAPPGLDERIATAIRSPNRLEELARLEQDLAQRADMTARQTRLEEAQRQAWSRLAEVENQPYAKARQVGATVAFGTAAVLSPYLGAGLAAYGVGHAYQAGGASGAAEAAARMMFMPLDVAMAGYQGYFEVDPSTGKAGGLRGAALGGGEALVLNTAMAGIVQRVQTPAAKVNPGASRTMGEMKDMPRFEPFRDTHARYLDALKAAKTPAARKAAQEQYATNARRIEMKERMDRAAQESRNMPEYQARMKAIRDEYGRLENRVEAHEKAIAIMREEALARRQAKGDGKDKESDDSFVTYSGRKPENALSDLDFTPTGDTPQLAYLNGKRYVNAHTKMGRHVIDLPDRWLITELDAVVWKPRIETGGPGGSAFEANVVHDSMFGSDKMATRAAVQHAVSKSTDDPAGAVIGHMKKAAEGFSSNPPDIYLVSKSLKKAIEVAELPLTGNLKGLKEKLDAIHEGHLTPEEAGIVTLGADAATRKRQTAAFLGEAQNRFDQSFVAASRTSARNRQAMQEKIRDAQARGDHKTAIEWQNQLAAYTMGNRTAVATLAGYAPGLVAKVRQLQRLQWQSEVQGKPVPAKAGKPLIRGYTPLAEQLKDTGRDGSAAPANPASPTAFADLAARCREGARRLDERIRTAQAGSEDGDYLRSLRSALEKGGANPASALGEVRTLSGFELATVLRQLGVPPGSGKTK